MRINGEYNGGFRLLFDRIKLSERYIRREDCPLRGKVVSGIDSEG